jgi:peptidoglycan/xylan/chitin deacetylase (PgdA/CDA1 family)
MITLVLVVVIVSAGLIGTVSFAASTETHGAISVAFDDGIQSQYDYAFPLMQARGIKATFYVVTDHISDFSNSSAYLSIAELQTLQDYGCEIASHSKTHPPFTQISGSQIREECNVSKQVLQSYGFAADNFAYPYGDRNNHTDSIVSQYYRSARSAYAPPYIMQPPISQFVLPGFAGETGDSSALPRLKSMIDEVYSTNGWAIIFFHNIIPYANNSPYTISSQDFESFLDYIVHRGMATITVDQGLDLTSPISPPPSVTISPTSVRLYVGQSQTFSSSVSSGNPPYAYQWYLNDSQVQGATSNAWTFTPASAGSYRVYLNVTDGLNFRVQSNVVSDILVGSVYLLLTAGPAQGTYVRGQSVTFTVNVFNQLDLALGSSLTLTVTGPSSYGYFDVQPISVPAGTVGEYTFDWVVPNVTGRYVVEVGLAPSLLTAYDTAWLEAA